tara:strand:+ start:46 stop:342 length:297 start_codon:yes stop_codon:yes gene_type:complete
MGLPENIKKNKKKVVMNLGSKEVYSPGTFKAMSQASSKMAPQQRSSAYYKAVYPDAAGYSFERFTDIVRRQLDHKIANPNRVFNPELNIRNISKNKNA